MTNVRSQGFCSALLPRVDMREREFRRACTFLRVSTRRSNLEQNPSLRTLELSQKNMPTNFQLKQLKLKLDIVC